MSAIASFYLLDTSKLEELKASAEITVKKGLFTTKIIDLYRDFLASNATELKSLEGSGYIFANLFIYLQEEKNIDLLASQYDDIAEHLAQKRGSSQFLFTHKQKTAFLAQLEPKLFSLAEIQVFNQGFSEEGDVETAIITLDALKVLYENLNMVDSEEQVLLLVVE